MALLASALPIPWRDVNQQGLSGIVEICSSDFREVDLEGVRVRDVITVLNKKLEAESLCKNNVRVVSRLMLYGVRVRSNSLVKSLIPELAGSSPRLVATTDVRVKTTRGRALTLFIETLTGKTVTVYCIPTDTVRYVKNKLEEKEGIPAEDQRLLYAGKLLRDDLTLRLYNIESHSTLHISLRMLGGFTGNIPTSRTFADVSDGSIITQIKFDPRAPEWRECSKGVNIEGRCENRSCRAFRHMVITRKKFELFNLILDDDIRCPICYCRVKPVTCGLYDCTWRYEGLKARDGLYISSRWQEAMGYVYHQFNADENRGSVEWSSLLMIVKSEAESVSPNLLSSTEPVLTGMCTICWSPFGSPVKTTTARCGHNFHRVCFDKWAKWCKHNHTQPSCPICRRTA